MENTKVKICGLARTEDVEAALRYGADYLGFIVEAESLRRLSVDAAARLCRPAIGCAQRAAVTVDASEELLGRIANDMCPDILQMHGRETPKWLRVVKGFTGLRIIKAVQVRTKGDLEILRRFEGAADYILLDAKPPKGAAQQGGHGLSFDWNLLTGFKCKTPLILAGGLSLSNIKAAKATGIKFFDVSSGVEASAGVKDASLMHRFMKAAHD